MEEISSPQGLELYASTTLFSPREFEEGIYYQRMTIGGNSLFSSLYVEEMEPGTVIDARYFHFGAGRFDTELVAKARHTIITSADILDANGDPVLVERIDANDNPYLVPKTVTDEILVTRIHNKPYLVITVTGGKAKIGVYITVNSAFAADLDSSLKLDGQAANIEQDKFIPTGGYDENNGRWMSVRIREGALYTVSTPGFDIDGVVKSIGGQYYTSPGYDVAVHEETIPPGKKIKIDRVDVISRSTGRWVLYVNGDAIATGRTGPMIEHSDFVWTNGARLFPGDTLALFFAAPADRPINDLDFFAQIVESDV